MKISDFLKEKKLDDSFLVGYYGGGNFGDELLLEVLLNLFKKNKAKSISVYYSNVEKHRLYHHDFGYRVVDAKNKMSVLGAIFKSKNIIIGGGGIWGLDFNANIFMLSALLFVSRHLLFKKVYLLGVGYYDSTTALGRFGAFLAAKASNIIIARDKESYENFKRFNKNVYLDRDLSFYVSSFGLNEYRQEGVKLGDKLKVREKTIFIALRRFQDKYRNDYQNVVAETIKNNPDKKMVLVLFEHKAVDPVGYDFLKYLSKKYGNLRILHFSYNPLAFLSFLSANKEKLLMIAPQYHGQIVSYLSGVKFLPIVYDNKNTEFLKTINASDYCKINDLSIKNVQDFINANIE